MNAEKFDDHPIHEKLNELETRKTDLVENADTDEPHIAELLETLELSLAFSRSCLERAIIPLAHVNYLDGAVNHVAKFSNSIPTTNAPEPGQANTAVTHLHNVCVSINALPKTEAEATKSMLQSLANSTAQETRKILRSLKGEVSQVGGSIKDARSQLDAFASQFENIHKQIEADRDRIAKAIQQQQQQFSDEQSKRNSEFAEENKSRQEEWGKTTDAEIAGWRNKRESLEKVSAECIAELNSSVDEAKDLVRLTGNVVLTGNYKIRSESEGASANQMRTISIACFVGMLVVVGLHLFAYSGETSLAVALSRIGLILLFLAPAAYAARESTRHRQKEYRFGRIELELAALEPFLQGLQAGEILGIKKTLAEKYFGKEHELEGGEVIPRSNIEFLISQIKALLPKK